MTQTVVGLFHRQTGKHRKGRRHVSTGLWSQSRSLFGWSQESEENWNKYFYAKMNQPYNNKILYYPYNNKILYYPKVQQYIMSLSLHYGNFFF